MTLFYYIIEEVGISFAINKSFPKSSLKIPICSSYVTFVTVDVRQFVHSCHFHLSADSLVGIGLMGWSLLPHALRPLRSIGLP